MLKKLAVPFLTLALATFGCSSSTTNNGTGGTGGGTGGTTGVGGKGGGAAGSSAAGTNGGGGKAGGGGGEAGSSAAGTNGGGGKAGGGGGEAGSSAAGTNGGGGKAGAGGAAGSSAAGTNGGGGKAGAGGAGGKADAGTSMADCNVTDSTGSDVLTAKVFCENFLAYCTGVTGFTPPAGYENQTACETSYSKSGAEHCRSYHLCWGVEGISMEGGRGNPAVHCQHTVGINLCLATDASSGN